jgi:hypothetical protein
MSVYLIEVKGLSMLYPGPDTPDDCFKRSDYDRHRLRLRNISHDSNHIEAGGSVPLMNKYLSIGRFGGRVEIPAHQFLPSQHIPRLMMAVHIRTKIKH